MRRLRWLLLSLALLSAAAVVLVDASEREDIASLHPDLRDTIQAVVDRLESEGHTVRISATWRSPSRQEAVFHLSRLTEHLGLGPGTTLRGGDSCHNQRHDGAAASAAADLRGAMALSVDEQADFYKALGRAAREHGLRWGGNWKRKNPTWAKYELGWDPGHVEHQALCQQLRDGT
ncbi:MAG: hypothetical protein ACI8RZ_001608 [Myxococcota bacterium]|jgi:hypothetical protein